MVYIKYDDKSMLYDINDYYAIHCVDLTMERKNLKIVNNKQIETEFHNSTWTTQNKINAILIPIIIDQLKYIQIDFFFSFSFCTYIIFLLIS